MSEEEAIKLDESEVRNGNILRVYNKNRKTNAKKYYWFSYIQLPSGEELPIMLTEREFQIAKRRARKNTEDCPDKDWLVDLFD
tara:strand:- start:2309 stop:2557 length:249 start_codon:yes stop_codon:yes gene_type:complete